MSLTNWPPELWNAVTELLLFSSLLKLWLVGCKSLNQKLQHHQGVTSIHHENFDIRSWECRAIFLFRNITCLDITVRNHSPLRHTFWSSLPSTLREISFSGLSLSSLLVPPSSMSQAFTTLQFSQLFPQLHTLELRTSHWGSLFVESWPSHKARLWGHISEWLLSLPPSLTDLTLYVTNGTDPYLLGLLPKSLTSFHTFLSPFSKHLSAIPEDLWNRLSAAKQAAFSANQDTRLDTIPLSNPFCPTHLSKLHIAGVGLVNKGLNDPHYRRFLNGVCPSLTSLVIDSHQAGICDRLESTLFAPSLSHLSVALTEFRQLRASGFRVPHTLTSLHFTASTLLQDDDFRFASATPQLSTIAISRLTSNPESLSKLPSTVTDFRVWFSGTDISTGPDSWPLSHLVLLTRLRWSNGKLFSFSLLPRTLEEFVLVYSHRFQLNDIQHLPPNLRRLELIAGSLDEASLAILPKNLTQLSLHTVFAQRCAWMTPEALQKGCFCRASAKTALLDHLRHVHRISALRIVDVSFKELVALPKSITELSCDHFNERVQTFESLDEIPTFPALTSLYIDEKSYFDKIFGMFASEMLPALRKLSFSNFDVAFSVLFVEPSLAERLTTFISYAEAVNLVWLTSYCPNLETIKVSTIERISTPTLNWPANLTLLECVNDDLSVSDIATLPSSMRTLSISRSRILNSAHTDFIKSLPSQLDHLTIQHHTKVTSDDLLQLPSTLRVLRVPFVWVSPAHFMSVFGSSQASLLIESTEEESEETTFTVIIDRKSPETQTAIDKFLRPQLPSQLRHSPHYKIPATLKIYKKQY